MKATKRTKFLPVIIASFCISNAAAETRDEVRKVEIQAKFNHLSNSEGDEKEEQKSASEIFTRGKRLGMHEFGQVHIEPYTVANILLAGLLPASDTDNIIILRFSCSDPKDIFPITFSQKSIKWKLDNGEPRESLTDREGYLRLRFTARKGAFPKRLDLDGRGFKKKVDLPTGPFEIFLDEDLCSK